MKRREFIGGLSASMALIAAGCRRPEQKIVPQVQPVEYLIPGKADYFMSAYEIKNAAYPISVKLREGRPIKTEGFNNPEAGNSPSTSQMQSLIYSLYDPDRFRSPSVRGKSANRDTALNEVLNIFNAAGNNKIWFFTDGHCSPAFHNIQSKLKNVLPVAEFLSLESIPDYSPSMNKKLFDIDGRIIPAMKYADVIISFDSDFLGTDINALHFSNSIFGNKHKIKPQIICTESFISSTGMIAEKRFVVSPDDYEIIISGLILKLIDEGLFADDNEIKNLLINKFGKSVHNISDKIYTILDSSLKLKHRVVFLAGQHLSAAAQVLCSILNDLAGTYNSPVFNESVLQFGSESTNEKFKQFEKDILSGNVHSLVFLDTNPYYFADNYFKTLLNKVPSSQKVHLGMYADETSARCAVSMPLSHRLESWSDNITPDNRKIICQPVIKPLNKNSLSREEFFFELAKMNNEKDCVQYDNWYNYFRKLWSDDAPGYTEWEDLLTGRKIILEGKEYLSLRPDYTVAKKIISSHTTACNSDMKIAGLPSPAVYDGKEANNAWLHEIPQPATMLTWGNALFMSRKTAKTLNLSDGDICTIQTENGKADLPALSVDGVADETLFAHFGYGRISGGSIAGNLGTNIFPLFNFSEKKEQSSNVQHVRKLTITGKTKTSAVTQNEHKLNSEKLKQTILSGTPEKFPDNESHFKYNIHKWGMVIDLSKCTGCGACVASCRAENNIPVVGEQEIIKGREINWLRIQSYYMDELSNYVNLPVMCQHCESAPCESVCPVSATTHSPEGVNEMTYNRCVGARFCMVNCPYRARRFNFSEYNSKLKQPQQFMLNPDVTVRMKGIAEKCTFCIQKINEARYLANDKGMNIIPDDAVKTACQTACPTSAIIFGNILNPSSELMKTIKESKNSFALLEEFNTKPAVRYIPARGVNK